MSDLKKVIIESVLNEDGVQPLKRLDATKFVKILERIAAKHASKATGSEHQIGSTSVRMTLSSAYGVEKNVIVHEGMFARQFVFFLKVGTAHDISLYKAVIKDVVKELKSKNYIPKEVSDTAPNIIVTWATGTRARIASTSGSAWGGIGYHFL